MSDPFADTMSMLDNWERNANEKAARFQAMNDSAYGACARSARPPHTRGSRGRPE